MNIADLVSTVSTPYGLDESLPNKERGILHIEGANYWSFSDLEYVATLTLTPPP